MRGLTDAATIAWDMAARPNDVKIMLSASRTLGAPTNMVTNQRGRLIVMQDGTEFEAGPGEITALPSGHDAWVVGDEHDGLIDWYGASNYAKQ